MRSTSTKCVSTRNKRSSVGGRNKDPVGNLHYKLIAPALAGWLSRLIAPIDAALRTMPRRVIAFEGAAKALITLAMPDRLDWLLKNIAQHPLLLVFPRAFMPKRREAAGKYIAAGRDIRQCIRPTTARPGALPKVSHQTFQRRRRTGRAKDHAAFLAGLLVAPHQLQFLTR